MIPTRDELSALAADLEGKAPQDILRWAWETYGGGLTMATAFGAEGCVIISMLAEISKEIAILNLETGYQFPETLETRLRLQDKYGIQIALVQSVQSVPQMEAAHGGPIYDSNPDLCCHIRKVVPLEQALRGYDAWIAAVRRDQAPTRAHTPITGWDRKFGLAKISPLAAWTKSDVWNYILDNDVPYNPLHDQGYPSIGCRPCTRPAGAGAGERSGRWAGSVKTECGLHVIGAEPTVTR